MTAIDPQTPISRELQGLGAEAIQPLILTILAAISASAKEDARLIGCVGCCEVPQALQIHYPVMDLAAP